MILRDLTEPDKALIDAIYQKHHSGAYGVPSLRNVLDQAVIEDEGGVAGYGMVKLFAEGIIVVNKDRSPVTQARVVKVGIDRAIRSVRRNGIEQFHVFTGDPNYISILQKHWNFQVAPGSALFIEV